MIWFAFFSTVCAIVAARGVPPDTIIIGGLFPFNEDGAEIESVLNSVAFCRCAIFGSILCNKLSFSYYIFCNSWIENW